MAQPTQAADHLLRVQDANGIARVGRKRLVWLILREERFGRSVIAVDVQSTECGWFLKAGESIEWRAHHANRTEDSKRNALVANRRVEDRIVVGVQPKAPDDLSSIRGNGWPESQDLSRREIDHGDHAIGDLSQIAARREGGINGPRSKLHELMELGEYNRWNLVDRDANDATQMRR